MQDYKRAKHEADRELTKSKKLSTLFTGIRNCQLNIHLSRTNAILGSPSEVVICQGWCVESSGVFSPERTFCKEYTCNINSHEKWRVDSQKHIDFLWVSHLNYKMFPFPPPWTELSYTPLLSVVLFLPELPPSFKKKREKLIVEVCSLIHREW